MANILLYYLAAARLYLHVAGAYFRFRGSRHYDATHAEWNEANHRGWVQVRCACGRIFYSYDNRKEWKRR